MFDWQPLEWIDVTVVNFNIIDDNGWNQLTVATPDGIAGYDATVNFDPATNISSIYKGWGEIFGNLLQPQKIRKKRIE